MWQLEDSIPHLAGSEETSNVFSCGMFDWEFLDCSNSGLWAGSSRNSARGRTFRRGTGEDRREDKRLPVSLCANTTDHSQYITAIISSCGRLARTTPIFSRRECAIHPQGLNSLFLRKTICSTARLSFTFRPLPSPTTRERRSANRKRTIKKLPFARKPLTGICIFNVVTVAGKIIDFHATEQSNML